MLDIRNLVILLLSVSLLCLLCQQRGASPLAGGSLDLVVAESGRNNRTAYEGYHVKNTITRNMSKVQACYLAFLEKNPTAIAEGEIFVDWQITPAGQAHEAAIVSTSMDNQDLSHCITGEIDSWKFPPTPSGRPAYSSFTFTFKKS